MFLWFLFAPDGVSPSELPPRDKLFCFHTRHGLPFEEMVRPLCDARRVDRSEAGPISLEGGFRQKTPLIEGGCGFHLCIGFLNPTHGEWEIKPDEDLVIFCIPAEKLPQATSIEQEDYKVIGSFVLPERSIIFGTRDDLETIYQQRYQEDYPGPYLFVKLNQRRGGSVSTQVENYVLRKTDRFYVKPLKDTPVGHEHTGLEDKVLATISDGQKVFLFSTQRFHLHNFGFWENPLKAFKTVCSTINKMGLLMCSEQKKELVVRSTPSRKIVSEELFLRTVFNVEHPKFDVCSIEARIRQHLIALQFLLFSLPARPLEHYLKLQGFSHLAFDELEVETDRRFPRAKRIKKGKFSQAFLDQMDEDKQAFDEELRDYPMCPLQRDRVHEYLRNLDRIRLFMQSFSFEDSNFCWRALCQWNTKLAGMKLEERTTIRIPVSEERKVGRIEAPIFAIYACGYMTRINVTAAMLRIGELKREKDLFDGEAEFLDAYTRSGGTKERMDQMILELVEAHPL